MSRRYYVRGKQIDLDYWGIDLNDIDEHDEENTEYVTDRHGKILGVAWELEK